MGDDGSVAVNLNFAFPFYDQTFNRAWMYDNGVISFLQPGTPGALSPGAWNSTTLQNAPGKYFIAGLWADLAPVSQTMYSVDHTATTAKFNWNNIAEYYSIGGTLRLSSFSVELNASGAIDTRYSNVNLQLTNISTGTRGDADFTQQYYSNAGPLVTSLPNWTATTASPPPPAPVPVVAQKPVEEAPLVAEAQQPAQAPAEPAPAQQTTLAPPTTTASAPAAASQPTSAAVSEPQQSTPRERRAVRLPSGANSFEQATLETALSVASASASTSSQSSMQVETQTTTVAVEAAKTNDMRQSMAAVSISGPQNSQRVEQTADTLNQQQQMVGNAARDATELAILFPSPQVTQSTPDRERPANRSATPPAEFGSLPTGFAAYSVALTDAVFYAPRTVYANQRTVDNTRALRQLSSEALHKQLVDMQYERR